MAPRAAEAGGPRPGRTATHSAGAGERAGGGGVGGGGVLSHPGQYSGFYLLKKIK